MNAGVLPPPPLVDMWSHIYLVPVDECWGATPPPLADMWSHVYLVPVDECWGSWDVLRGALELHGALLLHVEVAVPDDTSSGL